MKTLFSLTTAFALLTGAVGAQVNQQAKRATPVNLTAKQTVSVNNDLVAQLPASDFVATMNFKRLLSEVLPQVLASKPAELNKVTAGIDDIKAKTGIDLREFETAALSVNYKQTGAGKTELEPLFLLRGSFKPAALLGAVKLATNGKYRQETIAGKNAVIFTIPEAAKTGAATAKANSNAVERMIDKVFTGEVAVVALDNNTLAIAKPAQLRTTLAAPAKTRVKTEFTDYFTRKPTAVVNFAGNIPAEMISLADFGNDQINKIVGSLRQVYGTVDTNGSDASLALAAQTATDAQAQELAELLQTLQSLGKNFLGAKQGARDQAIARIVETLSISQNANRVQLEAIVPPDALSNLIK